MSEVRIAVQWPFGNFKNHQKDKKNCLSPVRKTYCVRALLQNALTCHHGN